MAIITGTTKKPIDKAFEKFMKEAQEAQDAQDELDKALNKTVHTYIPGRATPERAWLGSGEISICPPIPHNVQSIPKCQCGVHKVYGFDAPLRSHMDVCAFKKFKNKTIESVRYEADAEL